MERHPDELRWAKYSDSRLWKWRISPRFRLLPAFTPACAEIGCVGIRRRIPQRDCSGFSPDSMRPHQIIAGEATGHRHRWQGLCAVLSRTVPGHGVMLW